MRLCFDQALKAGKATKSNPKVGAILVYQNKIIGQGYHKKYGEAHAEVNAIASVPKELRQYIPQSKFYVSLEPCCFVGKTPACTNLILENKIKDVRISVRDPFPNVNGKGIAILKSHGVKVTEGILEEEGKQIIKPFIANNIKKRPYVILKVVESKDGFIGKPDEQVWLSNDTSKIMSHKWRSEIDGIMIGTNTALVDNPSLTTRLYPGDHPTRIVFDHRERIPKSHHILSDQHKTVILSEKSDYDLASVSNKRHIQINRKNTMQEMLEKLLEIGIYTLMIEGGSKLISSFVKSGSWDECRVIRCPIRLEKGIKSPLIHMKYVQKTNLDGDVLVIGHPAQL